MKPTPEIVLKQQELDASLQEDPHFVTTELEQVGDEWYIAVYHDEDNVRPGTYYKGTPIIFKKRKLSKR